MKKSKRFFFFILMVVLPLSIFAASVYMKQEADGSVSFSDKPSSGAQKVKIEKPNIIKDKKTKPKHQTQEAPNDMLPPTGTPESSQSLPPKLNQGPELPQKEAYKSVEITSPKDQETIWNPSSVSVSVDVKYGQNKMGLQKGDKLVLLLDGRKFNEGSSSMSFTLNRDQIPRGAHTLQATVVDGNNTVLITSKMITVYIMYKSVALLKTK